ncbi:MAG: ribonuclease HII [Nitrosomonas sp.]|uniref:ribonuclease HII n=1 Tax=Nitrosomonas sp. TaxID=42353 RepID=UPI002727C8CF|nr:ribonuclease HII [Nitrosomonas sp.]MDO9471260.1 ribonuclease HII [Nitrosomonas sp.]MDP1550118.1 ribonuclease HII [Nitrosomonas sp.]MDP1787649.1 ribonuclease HII [Nitrosomonas sp.]MDP2225133.1 ribonuclease HII [Nitrosomonas sp.]
MDTFSAVGVICGVDEAGRGPLAGPVYAACVVLNAAHKIAGLADSKELSEKKREVLAIAIKKYAKAWAIASASVQEIDQLNILQASLLAMKRAVESLPFVPDMVLVDGNQSPQLKCSVRTIIRGDSLIPEISAASILAKTARDKEMQRLHECFPLYGFDQHKGYPTKKHLAALQNHGACEIHRQSFAPVHALKFSKKSF